MKKIKWNENTKETFIKRPCECQCCYVCLTNSMCKIFGKYKCILCNEWRCGMCINIKSLKCNYCMSH
jgi:hypothetical protein